jgi:hypothetical protein
MVLARYDERPIHASTFVGKNLFQPAIFTKPIEKSAKTLAQGYFNSL